MLDTLNLDGSLLWATALTIVQLVGLAKQCGMGLASIGGPSTLKNIILSGKCLDKDL